MVLENMKLSAQENQLWCVYILRCGDGSLYTGITNKLTERIAQHQLGTGAKYTRSHLPVKVVFVEEMPDHSSALKREAAIKKLTRSQKVSLITRNTSN